MNLEEQTIIISFYDELDNMERELFDCPFTKETLIRVTEEYQRDSGIYNTSLFLLTDRKVSSATISKPVNQISVIYFFKEIFLLRNISILILTKLCKELKYLARQK